MINAAGAAGAYVSFSKLVSDAKVGGADEAGGFGQMVEAALGAAVESGRKGDAGAAAAVSGRGDLVDVVTAVSESQTALETIVSLRDRVIQAYEEIMRMPI